MRQGIVMLTIIALAGVSSASAGGPVPQTEEEKTAYAVGMALGRNLIPFNLTPAEFDMVKAGFADGALNKKPKVDLAVYAPKTNELFLARTAKTAEAEKKDAAAFLEKAAAEKGAQKKPSGLVFIEVAAGDGKQPTTDDKVRVHYTGTLRDGTVFDSSVERGQPAEFPVLGIIPCWIEALQLMKEHGKAKFVCPAALAYGDKGAPPKIKPGAPLAFEVELIKVSPALVDPHSLPEGHPVPGHSPPGATEATPAPAGSGKAE
jgi:FKBP-type peptidyl-prolyl cis-trans isomerase FkpA